MPASVENPLNKVNAMLFRSKWSKRLCLRTFGRSVK